MESTLSVLATRIAELQKVTEQRQKLNEQANLLNDRVAKTSVKVMPHLRVGRGDDLIEEVEKLSTLRNTFN